MTPSELTQKARRITDAVETIIIGKNEIVDTALTVLLSNGHLLIEDIPGVGKTTLAKAMSHALGLSFKRIQFTPDLLPSDITGSSIYNQKTAEFETRPGPVFANIVLADEINRTTPKTQSALLEAMEEHQVTIDGVAHRLPDPFFVIATQNNIEMAGTYPLPEAQLDRFSAKITMGHPDRDSEIQILADHQGMRPVDSIQPVTNAEEIKSMQEFVRSIHIEESVRAYIVDVVRATRSMSTVSLGASPRGSLNLLYACQARAGLKGRNYVELDDVKALATTILAHRIIIRPEQRVRGLTAEACVTEALNRVPVPR